MAVTMQSGGASVAVDTRIKMGPGTTLPAEKAQERISALVAQRAVLDLPEYAELLQAGFEKEWAIDAEPLIPEAKAERKAFVREATREACERVLARRRDSIENDRKRAIGEEIARARRDDLKRGDAFPDPDTLRREDRSWRRDQALATSWTLQMSTIEDENDFSVLETIAADAEMTENADVYRSAMTKILRQLERLVTVERRKGGADRIPDYQPGPAQQLRSRLSLTFDKWREAHPTPAEARARAERHCENQLQELDRSAHLYRRFYGLEAH